MAIVNLVYNLEGRKIKKLLRYRRGYKLAKKREEKGQKEGEKPRHDGFSSVNFAIISNDFQS